MKLTNIPDDHHVVRHCRRKLAVRDAQGVCVGVYPEFFYLREKMGSTQAPEGYLSCVYYEFHSGSQSHIQNMCRNAMPIQLSKGDALVKLNAAKVRQVGASKKRKLRVVHEESHPKVPSKARIEGLTIPNDDSLAAALAAGTIVSIF